MRRRQSVCEGGEELCRVRRERRDDRIAAGRRMCRFKEESRKVGRKTKRNGIRGRELVFEEDEDKVKDEKFLFGL